MITRLLDTCMCIFLIRAKHPANRERFSRFGVGELAISSITESELRHGAEKSVDPVKNHRQLDLFLLSLPVLPYGGDCARHYGEIRRHLEVAGTPIGSMDMLIAAHGRAAGLIVVTHNTREFNRVQGLIVEDWALEG
jgi:tRNA(fMet)-specific endonuclease VapC